MNLSVNIDDLLDGKAIECNRLEFKKGWNPDSIYRSICAFANDFEDIGGGYIVVGVDEQNGCAIRPVNGVPLNEIERIEKDMVGFNNLINPFFQPRLFIEEVDGRHILVIKVCAGERRPYKVPDNVSAKQKVYNYYIRYNSSSIVPKGEYERELIGLANRVPFDDRGNGEITPADISTVLLRDFLVEVKSNLSKQDLSGNSLMNVLDQMDLLQHNTDGPKIKNVAAMMFSEHPEKFFKTTQVDVVFFPEGRERNPDKLIEAPVIRGSVPRMIRDVLNYLKVMVVKEGIQKRKNDEHSRRFFNYPYQALEEAVVNALYHRDYQEREPVEITVEPDRISILSFAGPNHTIPMEAIHEAKSLRSRRYKNRRLGEFLKELKLTEGRATGIPTIQSELKKNGSAPATITTDENRTYFLIDIPCHPDFVKDAADQCVADNVVDNVVDTLKKVNARQKYIFKKIEANPRMGTPTANSLSKELKVSARTVQRDLDLLKKLGLIAREGDDAHGFWITIKN